MKPWQMALAGIGVAVWAATVGTAIMRSGHKNKLQQHEKPTAVRQPEQGSGTAKPISKKNPGDPASAYTERVRTDWLPEARSLPTTAPEDDERFGKILDQIDGLVTDIENGAVLLLGREQKAARSELIDTLSKKQLTLLPALRKRYVQALDAKLFRDELRVSASGSTLRFVGVPFASNANVEDMQTSMIPVAMRLRFKQVEYRWNAHIGDALIYHLLPPSDGVVARWDGSQFGPAAKKQVP